MDPLRRGTATQSEADAVASLGLIGRVLVAGLALGAMAVAVSGGISLAFIAVPFCAIGAILAIRRPRTSIGWILLAIGWSFATIGAPIGGSAEQFASGSVPWTTTLSLVLNGISGTGALLLLALLAMSFPSGHLPPGRWGKVGGLSIAIGLFVALVALGMPIITVSLVGSSAAVDVRNPTAFLPDLPLWTLLNQGTAFLPALILLSGAAISLAVRYRRATGILRQQLRWIGAALVFVVLAIVSGFVLSALVPGAGNSGVAWLPASVAFPSVPIAIGIAVLRYRLYEIDTIINRAIVYGLLTAILAGSSAAAVAVGERLFEGFIGPGSDVAIILTTLIVVTAFNPIKSRLQAVVDRRFKEAPDVALRAFVSEVQRSLSPFDRERTLRRLLEVAVLSYGAGGGEVHFGTPGNDRDAIAMGTTSAEPSVAVSTISGHLHVSLALSGSDPSRDPAPLRDALASVVQELVGET